MKEKENLFLVVLFFGGLWGITEATLGYLLHFLPRGVAGFFMFPIAFYFMRCAFRETNKPQVIFYTAVVAAGIKLIDLFIPFKSPSYTLNPAMAILLESAVVYLFMRVYNEKKSHIFRKTTLLCFAWRSIFLLSLFALQPSEGIHQSGLPQIILFLSLHSVINGLLIGWYLLLEKPQKTRIIEKYPILPVIIVVVAIMVEFGFSHF